MRADDPDLVAEVRRQIQELELGGVAEIAEALGVKRQRVSNWDWRRATSGFPAPLTVLASGPVYNMAAVRAWWETCPYRKDLGHEAESDDSPVASDG